MKFKHYLSENLHMHLGYRPLAAEAQCPVELHGTQPACDGALVHLCVHLGEEFLG